jgi:hypothetical protein
MQKYFQLKTVQRRFKSSIFWLFAAVPQNHAVHARRGWRQKLPQSTVIWCISAAEVN